MTTPHVVSLIRRCAADVGQLVRQLATDIVAYLRLLADRGEAGVEQGATRTAAIVALAGAALLLLLDRQEAAGALLAVAVRLWLQAQTKAEAPPAAAA